MSELVGSCFAADGVETTSSGTDAYTEWIALQNDVLLTVARRCADSLPGLLEVLQDDVMITAGGTTKQALGWFKKDAWWHGERRFHEIFVNADQSEADSGVKSAEDMMVTLLHEACHAYAHANGIADTSRDGRYHNRRFGQLAVAIGLIVVPDPVIGHQTPGLTPRAREAYADLLVELEGGLGLTREPKRRLIQRSDDTSDDGVLPSLVTEGSTRSSKYVFAACQCQGARGNKITIRIARGSWRHETIRCSVCDAWFVESPSIDTNR